MDDKIKNDSDTGSHRLPAARRNGWSRPQLRRLAVSGSENSPTVSGPDFEHAVS